MTYTNPRKWRSTKKIFIQAVLPFFNPPVTPPEFAVAGTGVGSMISLTGTISLIYCFDRIEQEKF